MKQTLLIFICLFISEILYAQSEGGTIRGHVTTSDQKPAPLVSVIVKGTTYGSATDENGKFEIQNVPPGSYVLVTSFIGLETREVSVTITGNSVADVGDIVLSESAQELNEVEIVGASERYTRNHASSSLRITTPLIELPQNVQVVTPEMLREQQVISMSDGLLRNVSGATRIEHWGDLYTNITARGSQLQAFRNGFNVVNSSWGPLTEDMSFVDHIEFVKGPAGFMLANGDPSGLYNVVTKKPTGLSRREVALTFGSFNLLRGSADVDGKLTADGKLLYRLNASAQKRETHRDYEYNNRYAIAPVLSWQVAKKTKITAEYTYQRADMSDVGSYYIFSKNGFAVLPRDMTNLTPDMPGTTIHDHNFYLSAERKINDRWKITAQGSRFEYRQEGSSMWPSVVNDDETIIRAVSSWEAKSSMTMGQLFVNGEVKTGNINHRVLTGIDLARKEYFADWGQWHQYDAEGAEFDQLSPDYGTPANGYPKFDYSTPIEERAEAIGGMMEQRYNAFYIQDELGFFDNRLRLTLAGRYTNINQSEYGGDEKVAEKITPRVGISVSLNKNTSVYGLYDQAFIPQAGTLSDGGDVKPITGANREIGIKRNWFDGKWSTTVSFYSILKRHELIADPNSPPSSNLSVELGEKTAKGIEFDLKGTVYRGLGLVANYAYTDSRVTKVTEGIDAIEEGDIVPGYAKHTANAWISYKITNGVLKGSGVSLGFTYLAGRETYWDPSPDPDQTLPDYFKLDGGLFWSSKTIRVTANVFNILDDYLYTGSYYSWLEAYYWQTDPPRNFRVSVSYTF